MIFDSFTLLKREVSSLFCDTHVPLLPLSPKNITFVFMIEITNNIRKLVSSLSETKHRKRSGLFKAEGTKCVLDTAEAFDSKYIFATGKWIDEYGTQLPILSRSTLVKCSSKDLERMSGLTTPPQVIAVYHIPEFNLCPDNITQGLTLALDSIQDPGNLGTIIRTADWFGIRDILCSNTTADVYNPKVVQATMGAISRVRLHYCDLKSVISAIADSVPIYGTFLDGENIYSSALDCKGIIVMGNEGNGVSDDVAQLIDKRLYIPSYPYGVATSESLNVGIATAITLSEFRRRII